MSTRATTMNERVMPHPSSRAMRARDLRHAFLLAIAVVIAASPAGAQSNLSISSSGTYNRVEGLPIRIGPVFRKSWDDLRVTLSPLGIMRTAHGFHWDSENIGHMATAEARLGRARGFSLSVAGFDVVTPVESWQIGDVESGLATGLFRRDYRDYFGRHGGSVSIGAFDGERRSLILSLSDERWSSRRERDVFTIWRDGTAWRPNPTTDDGRVHLATLAWRNDTRNDMKNPATGWFITAEYERAVGRLTSFGPTSPGVREDSDTRVSYGRATVDLRRYNRLTPTSQLHGRVFWGGRVHGGELPLQRRLSVGGVATVPGIDFRAPSVGLDVGQCSTGAPPPGNPAQCERVLLLQLEFRGDLSPDVLTSRTFPLRIRSREIPLNPMWVAFVDAGRGWLLGAREGEMRYSKGLAAVPSLGSFYTDVGLGLDLGPIGVYVAKSVSVEKAPANVFLRVRNRF